MASPYVTATCFIDGTGCTKLGTDKTQDVEIVQCPAGYKWVSPPGECQKINPACTITADRATTLQLIKNAILGTIGINKDPEGEIKFNVPNDLDEDYFCWVDCDQGWGYDCPTDIVHY